MFYWCVFKEVLNTNNQIENYEKCIGNKIELIKGTGVPVLLAESLKSIEKVHGGI